MTSVHYFAFKPPKTPNREQRSTLRLARWLGCMNTEWRLEEKNPAPSEFLLNYLTNNRMLLHL
jgi:hypothetical protein